MSTRGSYHWLVFKHLIGKRNPSDCLNKNLPAPGLKPFTDALMEKLLNEMSPTEHGA